MPSGLGAEHQQGWGMRERAEKSGIDEVGSWWKLPWVWEAVWVCEAGERRSGSFIGQ